MGWVNPGEWFLYVLTSSLNLQPRDEVCRLALNRWCLIVYSGDLPEAVGVTAVYSSKAWTDFSLKLQRRDAAVLFQTGAEEIYISRIQDGRYSPKSRG